MMKTGQVSRNKLVEIWLAYKSVYFWYIHLLIEIKIRGNMKLKQDDSSQYSYYYFC